MTNLSVIPGERELNQRPQAEELVRLFRLAEEKIKLVENLNEELPIPAINELRYAGYHMAQYLAGGPDADEQLAKAQNHCKRAIFDASEAGVTHQLEVFRVFKHDFRPLIVSETVPDFAQIEAQVRDAKKLILTPRNESDSREAYYEQCSVHLAKLREANERLDLHREDLLKALKRMNWMARTYYFAAAGVAIAFVGVVIGALSLMTSQTQAPLTAVAPASSVSAPALQAAPAIPATK